MLVEDDNNLREIYGARLLAEGHDIVSAKDGEEALALAVKEKPELIISDVMMPRISGFDMLDILRNAPETKFTKVIMMTALSQAEDKARASTLGADRYLVKSQVTLEDVARVVREVLEGKEAPGEESGTSSEAPTNSAVTVEATTPIAPSTSDTPNTPPEAGATSEIQPTQTEPQSTSMSPANDQVNGSPLPESVANTNTPTPAPQPTTPEIQTTSETTPSAAEPQQIDVQLPNLDQATEELKKQTTQVAEQPEVPNTDAETDDKDLSVGPNLAEALKSESGENSQPQQVAITEEVAEPEEVSMPPSDTPTPQSANDVPSAVVPAPSTEVQNTIPEETIEQPQQEQAATPEANAASTSQTETAQQAPTSNEPTSPLDDQSRKKIVIEPIHDLSKPDINSLLEKEQVSENTVTTPTTPQQPAQPNSPPPANSNDLISL